MKTNVLVVLLCGFVGNAVAVAACESASGGRLANRKVEMPEVRTVTHYGMTLDEDASPEQVAYTLLRAIRDDFYAADKVSRVAAIDKQLDVCAANEMAARASSAAKAEEITYRLVYSWTPTLAHYAGDFETEWEKAEARFTRFALRNLQGSEGTGDRCQVVMQARDPGGDPNASVLVVVALVQDRGYWRVLSVAFSPQKRSLDVPRGEAG